MVLDDLWDIASWDDLTRPFAPVENGSRIILTSRNREVALQGKRHSDPLDLRLLRPEESWELLEKRVYQGESCPVELLDVGKQIAQNCKGLPLVVDLIAGVMANSEKEKVLWLKVLKDLNSLIPNKEEEVMEVIQLSYDQLTDHLKLCLLYLGSYKKDEQIKVNQLKALWSAEGFVEEIEMKSAEEVVEDYFHHLVSSSLVVVFKGENRGKVIQIHDLIHDFCLIKARKEKLFDFISSSATSPSSLDLMPRQLTIHFDTNLPPSYKNIVLFNLEKKRDYSCNDLLSLKFIGGMCLEHLRFYICHLHRFRLLRVLIIFSGYIEVAGYLLNEIAMLVNLRYLKIWTTGIKALPLSFANLLNLETLVVKNSIKHLSLEPVIWNLAKLRYVEINPCCLYDLGTDEPALFAEDSKLENLRTLGWLQISCSKGPVDISKKFPKLQKLSCEVVKLWDSSAGCNWFPRFGCLNELEELAIDGHGYRKPREDRLDPNKIMSFEVKHQSEFSFFPLSLRYLQLRNGFVNSDSLSTIARLPNP